VHAELTGVVSYIDARGKLGTEKIRPITIGSVCPFLIPLEIDVDQFDSMFAKYPKNSISMEKVNLRVLYTSIINRCVNLYLVDERWEGLNGVLKFAAKGAHSGKFLLVKVFLGESRQLKLEVAGQDQNMVTGFLSEIHEYLKDEIAKLTITHLFNFRAQVQARLRYLRIKAEERELIRKKLKFEKKIKNRFKEIKLSAKLLRKHYMPSGIAIFDKFTKGISKKFLISFISTTPHGELSYPTKLYLESVIKNNPEVHVLYWYFPRPLIDVKGIKASEVKAWMAELDDIKKERDMVELFQKQRQHSLFDRIKAGVEEEFWMTDLEGLIILDFMPTLMTKVSDQGFSTIMELLKDFAANLKVTILLLFPDLTGFRKIFNVVNIISEDVFHFITTARGKQYFRALRHGRLLCELNFKINEKNEFEIV
jgi:hypothetical protein